MMAKTQRTFIAVSIPEQVARFIQNVQNRLRSSLPEIRWVAVKNIHLTLKFLGEIDPGQNEGIVAQMEEAALCAPPFSLSVKGVGVFPNHRQARVLWVGLAGDMDRLASIHAGLEKGLESVGFPRDRRSFSPHLTIGRSRRQIHPESIEKALRTMGEDDHETFMVERIGLYKSVLKPTGAEYTLLHASKLCK